MAELYTSKWYAGQHGHAVASAEILVPRILELTAPSSVADVGCGVGAWLSVFSRHGVPIEGFDGQWVDQGQLLIPVDRFRAIDLSRPSPLGLRTDLAMSLEVAEHIPADAADDFVALLVSLSDAIVFSAAIPWQGGKGHVNEQWPAYWTSKFRRHGYLPLDVFRAEAWTDERIAYWYAQNMVLYVSRHWFEVRHDRIAAYCAAHPTLLAGRLQDAVDRDPLPIAHPRAFTKRSEDADRYRRPFRRLLERLTRGRRKTAG